MMKKDIFSLIVLFLFIPVLGSYHLEDYNVKVDLQDGVSYQVIEMLIVNDGGDSIEQISFEFPADVYGVRGESSLGRIPVLIKKSEGKTKLSFQFKKPIEEKDFFRLEFKTRDFVGKLGERRIFFSTFSSEAPVKNFTLRIYLPPSMGLVAGERSLPEPSYIFSDGRRIILEWHKEELNPENPLTVSLLYENTGIPVVIEKKKNEYFLISILSFLLGVVFSIFAYKGIEKRKKTKLTLNLLNDGEREIIQKLIASGGSLTQDEITKQTQFSKAKVSIHLANLEKRGLIEKTPHGRTNLIVLKKDRF
ncbi:MAG: helix-turn-helix transcriptional regulator [Candidatus Hydrothermarchaeota archaeon]